MSVAPSTLGLPAGTQKKQSMTSNDGLYYNDGICDCFQDIPVCCLGCWQCGCMQILFGSNNETAATAGLWPTCGCLCAFSVCNQAMAWVAQQTPWWSWFGWFSAPISLLQCCFVARQRTKMRRKFGVQGRNCPGWCGKCRVAPTMPQCWDDNSWDDFCTVFWCMPCSICQDARMLRHYGIQSGVVPPQGVQILYAAPAEQAAAR